MEGTHEVGRRPFMPDSTLSRRSAALMGAWTRPPLLPKTHKFHTETAGEPFFSSANIYLTRRWIARHRGIHNLIQKRPLRFCGYGGVKPIWGTTFLYLHYLSM